MSEIKSSSPDSTVPGKSLNNMLWKEPIWLWGILLVVSTLMWLIFSEGLVYLEKQWSDKEEYSHSYMLPMVVLFMIWQKKNILSEIKFTGSYTGVLVVALGLFIFLVGELSTLYILIQYAFLVVVFGLFLTFMGWRGYWQVAIPLLILFFMIPLPNFLYNALSGELQLISSEMGVWFIRLFGISVYLEGNVIDLGAMQLQVVEACNGLRYLFPLMAMGFILGLLL